MASVLKRYAFYSIPRDTSAPVEEKPKVAVAVEAYLNRLLDFLGQESTVRNYYFPTDREPEARAKILELPAEATFASATSVLARRLHEMQRKAEHGAIEVQLGDLLTVHYEQDGAPQVLLAKLEQADFLSKGTWEEDTGFPSGKNLLLKSCVAPLTLAEGNWEVGHVTLFDSNGPISKFWWQDFLEVLAVTTDAQNSHNAHSAWKSLLETVVRPKSKVDYLNLRNVVGYYFRNPQPYIHKDAVKAILRHYQPIDAKLDISPIISKAEAMPKQGKRFDEQFTIDPKACNIRIRPVRLTDEIDLVFRQPVEHLSEIVKPKKIGGEEGVFIVSPEGYRQFSPSQHKGDGKH